MSSIVKEYDDFFNFKAKEPLLFLLNNREALDIIWGNKTEAWLVGAFKNNSIYILNPEVYETESSHKKEEFWMNLKHEYCHAYYAQITKSPYPIWLNEGLASFKSGKKLNLTEDNRNKLLNVFNYFDKSDRDVYPVGQFWVEYLLKKFGNKKFLNLINSFSYGFSRQDFNQNFYKVYGFKFNKKVFSEFLKQFK